MEYKTIDNLKEDIAGQLGGANINAIRNFFGKTETAMRSVLSKCAPYGLKQSVPLVNALYDRVYDYVAVDRISPHRIINIYPSNRKEGQYDYLDNRISRDFNRRKENFNHQFSLNVVNGVNIISIDKPVGLRGVLDTMNSPTANGAWVDDGNGNTSSIGTNTAKYVSGNASVQVVLTGGSGSGGIKNTTLQEVDVSTYVVDETSVFVWVYIPNTNVTEVQFAIGNDESNYYQQSQTTTHTNQSFTQGWNLLRFDLSSDIETGNVDMSALQYAEINFTHSSASDLTVLVDNITIQQGEEYRISFYSNKAFQNSDDEYLSRPTAGSDRILLDPEAYALLTAEMIELCGHGLQQADSGVAVSYARSKKNPTGVDRGLYREYNMAHPDESMQKTQVYWNFN